MLKHFKLNTNRDKLYPGIECYQMDLSPAVEMAIKLGLVEGEMKELPSWQKFVAHPIKAKGFFTNILQSIFQGKGNNDELNVDLQVGNISKRRTAMMFLPDNTRKDMLDIIGKIAQQTLDSYEVITLNGLTTTQKKAESYVKEIIEKNPNKSILILSAKMAQRSFSEGLIDELYLAYDRGANGPTTQKISRALTPKQEGKIGRVFSLSFDPNRDDKFDAMIIQTALNQIERNPESTDIVQGITNVISTIDIFTCTKEGAIPITVDTFVEEALSRKSISRAMGKKSDISGLSDDMLNALANGDINYLKDSQKEITQSGKTREPQPKNSRPLTPHITNSNIELVKEMITTIIENTDIIISGTNQCNIKKALNQVEEWGEEDYIAGQFGLDYGIIKYIFEENIIKQEWVNILYKAA
tara:strand:+ start:1146 stop:2384 length:1239 start_codon:yes stop_codon:yes gene_type:complete